MSKRICIITNAPISQNPRAVKEADALSAAGYAVTVLFAQHAAWTVPLDAEIVRASAWEAQAVQIFPQGVRRRLRRGWLSARAKLFGWLAERSFRFPIAELAYSRFFLEQTRRAVRLGCDLYIGHNPQSLPIVARAARRTGGLYAFDAEDLHTGQYPAEDAGRLENRLLTHLEQRYLAGCRYVTAASRGIGEELSKRYAIPAPATVLNVFPWADRDGIDGMTQDRSAAPGRVSLYWYSQIVSLDRGLQEAVQALGQVRADVELHIRGALDETPRRTLLEIARRGGVADRLFFHEPVTPGELLSRAAEHDIGLCLEVPATLNRDLCVTNKIFLFLLAGLAVIASATRGQAEVMAMSPGVGAMYEPGDVAGLAQAIERLAKDRALLARSRTAALASARERWNWEREQGVLLDVVGRALGAA